MKLAMAQDLLEARRQTMREIATRLSRESRIPTSAILGTTHDPLVVRVRHQLWAELRDLGMSTPMIGTVVGRDHTTVLAALKKCASVPKVRVAV